MIHIDPAESMTEYELNHLFLTFCSYINLTSPKKLNLANVFLLILQNKRVRELFKHHCNIKNDYAVVKTFLQFEPSLYKSKYIMKYLNSSKIKIAK